MIRKTKFFEIVTPSTQNTDNVNRNNLSQKNRFSNLKFRNKKYPKKLLHQTSVVVTKS